MDSEQGATTITIILTVLPGLLALIGVIYTTIAHRRENKAKAGLDDASALDKTSEAYSRLVEGHQRRIASLETGERHEREQRKKIEAELRQAQEDINNRMRAHNDCEERIKKMGKKMDSLGQRMEALEARNAALEAENHELKQRVGDIEKNGYEG